MGRLKAEYLWIDGHKPTAKLRSKTKIFEGPVKSVKDIPEWGFDGSSTMQAEGTDSDCALIPVYFTPDPIRGGDNILVMCEVYNAYGYCGFSSYQQDNDIKGSTFRVTNSSKLSLLYLISILIK